MDANPLTRRTALKYAGIIGLAARGWQIFPGHAAAVTSAKGYGTDPDLLKRPVTWPKTLTTSQLKSLTALCEIILPTEPPYPSAAAIGVQDFVDEWVSAPYPQMQADRAVILNGLARLDENIRRDHGVPFPESDREKQTALFDNFCATQETQPFARRLIELVCAGYYTTREGHAAIGYVGNVPLERFPPPSPEIVNHFQEMLSAPPRGRN